MSAKMDLTSHLRVTLLEEFTDSTAVDRITRGHPAILESIAQASIEWMQRQCQHHWMPQKTSIHDAGSMHSVVAWYCASCLIILDELRNERLGPVAI